MPQEYTPPPYQEKIHETLFPMCLLYAHSPMLRIKTRLSHKRTYCFSTYSKAMRGRCLVETPISISAKPLG
ncbi:MAG: hypothetical protein AAGI90_04670 [Chlamydiota bacterium]